MRGFLVPLLLIVATNKLLSAAGGNPLEQSFSVFEGIDGVIAVEAEHLSTQVLTDKKQWHPISRYEYPDVLPDGDPEHVQGASGFGYLECLPDTLGSESEGIGIAGETAVLNYRVRFAQAGRYYVWVRVHAAGKHENSLHVGLNDKWCSQALRWQPTDPGWSWEKGDELSGIFLDVQKAGDHWVQFSMCEDGVEFDKFLLTRNRDHTPKNVGPRESVEMEHLQHLGGAVCATLTPVIIAPVDFAIEPIDVGANGSMWSDPLPTFQPRAAFTVQESETETLNLPLRNPSGGVRKPIEFPKPIKSPATARGLPPPRLPPFLGNLIRSGKQFPFNHGRYDVTLHLKKPVDELLQINIRGPGTGTTLNAAHPSAMPFTTDDLTRTWTNVLMRTAADIEVFSRSHQSWIPIWSKIVFGRCDGWPMKRVIALPAMQAKIDGYPVIIGTAGNGSVRIAGDLRQSRKVTLTLAGPAAHKRADDPNPDRDYRMTVAFAHESGGKPVEVRGRFVAGETDSALKGNQWSAEFVPPLKGKWNHEITVMFGARTASAKPLLRYSGIRGEFEVEE